MLENYQLELRHIRYFLSVAEELHFRNAADKLYISQPGLSRQIKQLEEEIGVQLFNRHNRKVELTDAGQFLKTELTAYLTKLDLVFERSRQITKGYVGKLTFGYVGSASRKIIPTLLKTFKKQAPDVRISLNEMDNIKQLDELLAQTIDIGFVRLDQIPKGLRHTQLLEENFCLVLPKKHKITSRNFKNLSQLKEEAFILFEKSYSPSYFERVMHLFVESGFSPQISHRTIHAATIFTLIENGLGISVIPKSLVAPEKKNLQFIELKKSKQKTVLSAVWNPQNPNPVLKSLLALLTPS